MSSSISSFKTELKVIGAVLATLLVIEIAMRSIENRLSLDIQHIRAAPNIASNNKGTLALGNSLLREGVDMKQLDDAVSFYPDGTSIQEWAYAYRRFFSDKTKKLILFTGRTHLRDLPPRPTQMGAFYCAISDIPLFFRRKGSTVETDSEFLLARVSSAYAQRMRIQPRVFTAIIPHFQTALREMNARVNATKSDLKIQWHYDDLALLLESSRHTVIVTVPAPAPYELAPEILALAKTHDATVIDIANKIEGISLENFPDGWHLDEEGAQLFTRRLVRELAKQPPFLP
jgi:hypothetical protein